MSTNYVDQTILSLKKDLKKVLEAITELKEIDSLLTKIQAENSSLSEADLTRIAAEAFSASDHYGVKVNDYLSSFRAMARPGYPDTEGLTELSIAAMKAGDLTSELANRYIFAADKAFQLNGNVKELTEILDGSTNIAAENAVTLADLAEGMSLIGPQAKEAKAEANETAAALGVIASVTKTTGSAAAEAFGSVLTGIQRLSREDKNIFSDLNISLEETRNGITSLREPMDILEDLAEIYSGLAQGDSGKMQLAETFSPDNPDAFDALLTNWDLYEKMLGDYARGAGVLKNTAENAADSWDSSLNRLSNTWTETVGNIADSDVVIASVNGLNGLLSVVNSLTEALGPFGTASVALGAFLNSKNLGRANHSCPRFQYAENHFRFLCKA